MPDGHPVTTRKHSPADYVDVERLLDENQRLLHEAQMLRNQNREKDDEIGRLHVYIAEQARLRNLIKGFVFKIDAIIILRLTQRIRQRKRYPAIGVADTETDPTVILSALRQADRQAFLTQPSPVYKAWIASLKATLIAYKAVRHATFRTLRSVRRAMIRRKQRGYEE